jgi:uncharacterized protein DUF1587/cytochrome c
MAKPIIRWAITVAGFASLVGLGAEAWLLRAQVAKSASSNPIKASVAKPSIHKPVSLAPLQPVLTQYCVVCHDSEQKTAGLALDAVDTAQVGKNAAVWEKVARKLRTQEMPPPGMPRPDKATYLRMNALLEAALDADAVANPNPGRVAVHRLNRVEYTNAVRDLLGLRIDGAALLSADDANQEGFDNIASILSISPALLENYLSAARKISRLAV